MKLLNVLLWTSSISSGQKAKNAPNEKMSRAIKFYTKHCAAASPSDRIDCGYPGITADQCQVKKCCWDESVKGVPFCYQSAFWARNGIRKGFWIEPLPKECPSEPKSRVNCGFSRITPDQCESLGCCFDDQVRNVPWCFHKNEVLPKDKPIAKTVHRTKNKFCSKMSEIGKTGIDYECTDGFRDASVCSLSCSNGISEGGKTFVRTCLNGEWVGDLDDMECDVVLSVPQFSNKMSRTFGANMARILGYRVQRLITGGKCSAPPTPENGTRHCRQNREPGREYQYFCDFKCNSGYQQIGSTTRSCPSKYGNSNSWSGDAVRCEPINETAARQIGRQMCFRMEPSDENIRVKCEPGDMYGEIQCTYSCTNPSDRLMRGPSQVTCQQNSYDPIPVRPVCISGFCDAIGQFKNGNYECTNGELNGSECNFRCEEGFRLSGAATVNCGGNEWDAEIPRCIPNSLFSEGECIAPQSRVRRMIGGSSSSLGGFQVAIYYQGKFKCGGSLIAPNWVLTAAHCILGKVGDYQVFSNVRNAYVSSLASANQLGVEKIIPHEQYTGKAQWDIGLVQVQTSSPINQVLCLPETNFRPTGSGMTLYGYGSTSPYKNIFPSSLQHGALEYFASEDCGYIKKRFDADNLFCAKGTASACQGDSGGPVTFEENGKTLLLGVTSSGRCGNDNKPGLYVRVAKFIPWIHQHVLA